MPPINNRFKKPTLSEDLLADYLTYLSDLAQMTPDSIRHNRRWIERIEEAYGGSILGAQTASQVNAAILEVAKTRKVAYNGSPQSEDTGQLKFRLGRAVVGYMRWAYSENFIQKNIYQKNPFRRPHSPEANWHDEERTMALYKDESFSLYDRALIRFLIDTGCRVGEMCQIKLEDVDLDNGHARIFMPKVKRLKDVPLSEHTCKTLKALIKRRRHTPFLFHSRQSATISPNAVRIRLRKLGQKLGYRINPHSFRHAAGTLWVKHHGEIQAQKLLGHVDHAATARYTHYLLKDLKEMQSAIYEGRLAPRELVSASKK